MFCKKCGKQLDDSAKFCDNCGQQTTDELKVSSNPSYVDCALAYIPILFWLPYATSNNSEFARKCSNQGLILLIFNVLISAILGVLGGIFTAIGHVSIMAFIPIIFNILISIASFAVGGLTLAAIIIGIVRGLKGEFFEVPIIGKITIIK